jgi:hypothetical protein
MFVRNKFVTNMVGWRWTEHPVAGSVTCNEGGCGWLTPIRGGASVRTESDCAQGLRPVQIWIPDVNAEGFTAEAHRQSRAVAASDAADDDQAFVDSVSEWPEP